MEKVQPSSVLIKSSTFEGRRAKVQGRPFKSSYSMFNSIRSNLQKLKTAVSNVEGRSSKVEGITLKVEAGMSEEGILQNGEDGFKYDKLKTKSKI